MEIKYSLPKVSVVSVVWNDKDGIDRTITSVKSQSYPEVEYVVVDGKSDDGTVDLLNERCSEIDILISEPDTGIYNAMTKGIGHSTGHFVILMNGGDEFHDSNSLMNLVISALAKPQAQVTYGHHNYINEKTGKAVVRKGREMDSLVARMPFNHQSCLFLRSLFKDFPFNETYKYAADYEHIVRLHKNGIKFKLADVVVANFYAGGASESGIRPYLDVLKIQFDYFDRTLVEEKSIYLDSFYKEVKRWKSD